MGLQTKKLNFCTLKQNFYISQALSEKPITGKIAVKSTFRNNSCHGDCLLIIMVLRFWLENGKLSCFSNFGN